MVERLSTLADSTVPPSVRGLPVRLINNKRNCLLRTAGRKFAILWKRVFSFKLQSHCTTSDFRVGGEEGLFFSNISLPTSAKLCSELRQVSDGTYVFLFSLLSTAEMTASVREHWFQTNKLSRIWYTSEQSSSSGNWLPRSDGSALSSSRTPFNGVLCDVR